MKPHQIPHQISVKPHRTTPGPAVPSPPESVAGTAGAFRALLAVAVLPALVVAAVALSPPAATPLICAGLLGAGCTAVGFAVAGWRCLSRRTPRSRTR
ncbi:hypothetical protein DMH18_35740 [Streptomyces sp. WAC 06783]|uniref:hypothetical protein n=1 Tax=Streptomyces sp. WAC 06783 TaxID=2203211 RepID=UPI000F74BF2A|nr:hypothetical protein [Streptomyces sp. WAC 06783]RSO03928.1 hypothetical protein DMH18_35740 [Streptomyces sp. WAC 06783]